MQILIEEIFRALNLRPEHAVLFLTLLEHPNHPAGRLAQLARIKRTHTYALLSDLVDKNLAEEVQTEGIRRFRATSPQGLLKELRSRVSRVQASENALLELLPVLESLIPKSSTRPRVRFFQGVEGVKELYNLSLKCREKVIHACADFATLFPEERSPELNRWLWRYSKRRAKRGIRYEGIVNRSQASNRAFRSRKTEMRKLKMMQSVPISVEICIFDESVAICSTAKDMMGVLVESPAIADSARMLHQCLWKLLPDYAL